MSEANSIAAGNGTDQTVIRSVLSDHSVSGFFGSLMVAVRDRFRDKKVAEEFAGLIGCDSRSASRYLSGERFPSGPQTIALFEDGIIGPQAVAALLKRLPPERRKAMAKALADAADIAGATAELELAQAKLAKMGVVR